MTNFRLTFLLALIFALSLVENAQIVINFQTAPSLPENDVRVLVEIYSEMSLDELQSEFGKIKADQTVKNAIAGLPALWQSITLTPAQVGETRLWLIGAKALKLTGSLKYEFIYLDNATPLAVTDSNCIMAITSGMMKLTDGNDDALFGVMVHEIAHGIFATNSVETKKQFNAAIKAKDYARAEELRKQLAMIEIKCDLIAGRIMQEAKYKVAKYADLQVELQQIEEALKVPRSVQWHPVGEIRKQALLGLKSNNDKVAKN